MLKLETVLKSTVGHSTLRMFPNLPDLLDPLEPGTDPVRKQTTTAALVA